MIWDARALRGTPAPFFFAPSTPRSLSTSLRSIGAEESRPAPGNCAGEMRTNQTKARLLDGQLAVGIFVMANHLHVPGVIASCGYDFVHYDLEHSSLSLAGLESLVRAAHAAGITPLTRVAGSTKADILAVLE